MFRQLQKLLAVTTALLFFAGCQTHDRVIYRNPVPWKTHPAVAPELPAGSPMLLPAPTVVPPAAP